MNIRTAIKRFNTLYGRKKRRKSRRFSVELPEERDAKAARAEARKMGFKKMSDYFAWKKKKKEEKKPWYAGRSSGRFKDAAKRKVKKTDYSPSSGNYFRG